jgi:cytidylate kinase
MMRVVAIDGPSGSGKSTVARAVAAALGMHVLDTGAMYRSVTLRALDVGADLHDEQACAALAADARIELEDEIVRLDGQDVSEAIRGPEVTKAVSTVAAHPAVRAELVARQRAWVAQHGGGVVEGRDIGTVVFPDAPLKVFITASDEERARRRHGQEQAASRAVGVESVREDIARRDAHDSGRAVSPLRPAEAAWVIDTTAQGAADVAAQIVERFTAVEAS